MAAALTGMVRSRPVTADGAVHLGPALARA
jgi:hypothetical protein